VARTLINVANREASFVNASSIPNITPHEEREISMGSQRWMDREANWRTDWDSVEGLGSEIIAV
jgi:hypothetical protein